MQVKSFEILDRATFIPAMGIKMKDPDNLRNKYLLKRAGYGQGTHDRTLIFLIRLIDNRGQYDPHDWSDSPRTMRVAHEFIEKNWNSLTTGSVIDVELILGETDKMKRSEQEYDLFLDKHEGLLNDPSN
jgi:hypothetical protein